MEISKVLIFNFLYLSYFVCYSNENGAPGPKEAKQIRHSVVEVWANKIGMELWHFGNFITRRKDVQNSFSELQVVPRNGQEILDTMASALGNMFNSKINATLRIMDAAENAAMSHQHDKVSHTFQFYNAKEILNLTEDLPPVKPKGIDDRSLDPPCVPPLRVELRENPHFFRTLVNTSMSSVHVPTNVYARADNVLKDIQWSEKLDSIFIDNYRKDPTLSWQFFGSSTGFMRQFPATKWIPDPVDLFDCRMRSWYIEAAASPKDMIILVDISGSMKGQRQQIAKQVVSTILETLTTSDFVNVYKFSEQIESVVECFNESLVPATLANIRELNSNMENILPGKIANYSAALVSAFEILQNYRLIHSGAGCNQAIMIISDGVPYDFRDIFEQYNNIYNNTFKPVRVFTYLIGREVPDFELIKDMACRNQGYYVHLSVTSEVREQVLNYIPVMARPLVLGRSYHPVIWSQVYADVVDPKMTDYNWERKMCKEQKEIFMMYLQERGRRAGNLSEEQPRQFILEQKREAFETFDTYNLLTTVSIPVYDRRENATAIANILGVAGVDVPIEDIKRLLMPHTLGVHGYAFIVTNNGYILTHPDFRPEFKGILKPAYNSIDMLEVELVDDDRAPRDFSNKLLEVREQIVNQLNGSSYMWIKSHMDNMTRVTRLKRHYYWTGIPNTPFTLVVTYPEMYGLNRVEIQYNDDVRRKLLNGINILSSFEGRHWRIHPKWLYCKHAEITFDTPEDELKYFLDRATIERWKWKDKIPLAPEHAVNSNSNSNTGRPSANDKDNYYCDRSLVQEVVSDAKATEWFSKYVNFNSKDDKGPSLAVLYGLMPRHELKQRFRITLVFLATHSGLTRWLDFQNIPSGNGSDGETKTEVKFESIRTIDEVWYKRAVEQYYIEQQSFVFSVPYNDGETKLREHPIVTATHAIFHTVDKRSAPVAVVGYQFNHSAFFELFKNTTTCGDTCERACFSQQKNDDIECFVLDNHGFVIVSQQLEDTGRFFGEIRGRYMERLVSENIYDKVNITDYQAVCEKIKNEKSPANILHTPLLHLLNIIKWISRTIAWIIMEMYILPVDANEEESMSQTEEPYDGDAPEDKMKTGYHSAVINRTKLYSCDKVVTLYTLSPSVRNRTTRAHDCERPFAVLPIPSSNLILLVRDMLCPPDDPHYITPLTPKEEVYGIYGNGSLVCQIQSLKSLYRRRSTKCVNQHPKEKDINHCGGGSHISISVILIALIMFLGQIL